MNNPVNCIDITGNFACTAIEKHSSDPMYSFAYDGLGIRGNSLEVEAKKLVKESTEIIERVISHNNQTYVTYDAKIDSNNFSKWKDDIETLSTVIRYYSRYLYLEIAELKDANNHPAYWTMSQNHIYSEMMAHVTIWFTFGVDKTERVDLNVDENRLIALVPMLFWGFEGKDELEWRDVQ